MGKGTYGGGVSGEEEGGLMEPLLRVGEVGHFRDRGGDCMWRKRFVGGAGGGSIELAYFAVFGILGAISRSRRNGPGAEGATFVLNFLF